MNDKPRLIERAFPLKQASLDSVHEKNVRHGHISTLHIWPARRPLAACRAALIATLLPDPGTPEARKKMCEKFAGKVVEKSKKVDGETRMVEETEGGILHWHRETENADTLEWFRQEIRKAYGGRAPKVLDPFAGGGAIPLEAMRLGCDVVASDLNPVAWFVLKCTLDYPQRLAGQTHPLPAFILSNREFMAKFLESKGLPKKDAVAQASRLRSYQDGNRDGCPTETAPHLPGLERSDVPLDADLAWHFRAWGQWVLGEARRELVTYYPTYADFEPIVGQASRLPPPPQNNRDGCPTSALFLNPYEPLDIRQRRLPHWTQSDVTYFVTFRLADSLPKAKLDQWHAERNAWLERHSTDVGQPSRLPSDASGTLAPHGPLPAEVLREYHRLFGERIEQWLDVGGGECLLRRPDMRAIVCDALRHFDGRRYDLGAWAVMPNHVHVLVRPHAGYVLADILHSWKSFTAHEINKLLGRQGQVWQHESYDHILRNMRELWRVEAYILNNPTRAGLGQGESEVADVARLSLSSFTVTENRFATETVAPPLMRLVPTHEDGTLDMAALNGDFTPSYLAKKENPRWVAKPTVAYLWARTVKCKNCRATIPLLKTLWLCKKSKKRVLLTMEPNADGTGMVFGVNSDVPKGNDAKLGQGTMSRAGTSCPCCASIMTMEDIRLEGKAGRIGMVPTAVVTESQATKVYRLPTQHEIDCAAQAEAELENAFSDVPFGLPTEPTPAGGGTGASRAFSIQGYGLMQWCDLFSSRQLLTLGTMVKQIRRVIASDETGLPMEWREAIGAYLAVLFDKTADYSSTVCTWHNSRELIRNTFARFAIPIMWDIAECATINNVGGAASAQLDWIARYIDNALIAAQAESVGVIQQSATQPRTELLDVIVTDPPYYDAIPYSDCMDFFYVWLKRIVHGTPLAASGAFDEALSPKWNTETGDGELIDDSSRHEGDAARSKLAYEDGMARAFGACHASLQPDGRLVIVFAHKQPDAWETLVSAIIRAGFIVDGSWPIQTEMGTRMRAMSSAALSSSLWLVCRKRPPCRPGWAKTVLDEMQKNIGQRLTEFWDAGIRGPDFVWAALGPALEAYSKYPVVKTDNPESPTMSVQEFLMHARRMVVEFVVGCIMDVGQPSRLPSDASGTLAPQQMADRLDGVTAYYLLHRNDFGLEAAPSGACILYAISCGVSDHDLAHMWGLTTGGKSTSVAADEDEESSAGSGSEVGLLSWAKRKGKSLGYEAPGGREIPIIDRIHRLMHLWAAGDVAKVDAYLDDNALRRNELFRRVLQAIIELAEKGSDERALLESISNHVQGKGAVAKDAQSRLSFPTESPEDAQ